MGCGDVGLRVNRIVNHRFRVIALTSSASRIPELRACGITPILGNLDRSPTVRRLAGIATRVLHLAPPPLDGWTDPRTSALVRTLRLRSLPRSAVYGSTSGVYGDCQGQWIDETRNLRPQTARACRRVDAESSMRFFGRGSGVRTSMLRIPGIYAPDRDGGTPRNRLLKSVPVLRDEDDVFTNHIHADDLAAACFLALWKGGHQRCYNINDDSSLKMGDYYDQAADCYGLPRPARIAREQARAQLPAMLLSFMQESRRMSNKRMKSEIRLRLRYPSVIGGLGSVVPLPSKLANSSPR